MKKLLISLVILTAFVTLPIKALSQRNDNWFKTTDDYENRADFNTGSTGLGTQGFGQEPQAPLGSGLMILTAIGAGYAFTKSKKMRKKAGLMVMAFAMVMGMTQCKKNVPTVIPDSVYDGPTTYIRLMLSTGSDSKIDVNLNFSNPNEAPVTFQSGDKIEVAYNGQWIGTLDYKGASGSHGQNGNALGLFGGLLKSDAPPTGSSPLYFYFLGNKTPVMSPDGAFEKLTIDISDQSNELPVISYAASKQPFEQGITDYTVEYNWLLNQCALVKFEAENIYNMSNNTYDNNADALYKTTQAITIYGMDNEVTVRLSQPGTNDHFNWAQTSSGETAGAITMYKASTDTEGAYRYAIVHHGTYNITEGNLEVAFNPTTDPYGYFGTYKLQGEIAMNDYYQNGKLDLVWHSGAFSVSEKKQVVFSRGNLQYKHYGSTTPDGGIWRFAKHQYDWAGGWVLENSGLHTNSVRQGNVVLNENDGESTNYSENEQIGGTAYTGWIDLFGFGTGDAPTKHTTANSDYRTFNEWGAHNIVNSGKPNNTSWWTTLSKDEYVYMIETRSQDLYGFGEITVSSDLSVHGLILLPDNWQSSYHEQTWTILILMEVIENTKIVVHIMPMICRDRMQRGVCLLDMPVVMILETM